MRSEARGIVVAGVLAGLFLPFQVRADDQHAQKDHPVQHDQKAKQPASDKDKIPELPKCPVMGDPVDFSVSTMTDEGSVYFCCESCIKKFKKDPSQYTEKTEKQRKEIKKRERIQVLCPISGKPIDGKTSARIQSQKVSFCCKECVAKYEKEPAKFKAKLEASYTYQTKCPIMGGEIDPTAFATLSTGQRVYFCCPGCDKKLLAYPEKYAPKLAEQGTNIDVKKLKADKSTHEEHADHKDHEPKEGHEHKHE